MKPCAYCGKENEDEASVCAECGTSEFKSAGSTQALPDSPESTLREVRLSDILADPVKLFRVLVLASTVTNLIWFSELTLARGVISQVTWDALAWHGVGALLPMPPAFVWLFLGLSTAVSVGLWMFSKSARVVFASLCVFWIIMAPFDGIQVQTAFGSLLLLLTNMADGAILVLAYTSPLKERFE